MLSSLLLVYAFQQFLHRAAVNEIERVFDANLPASSKGALPWAWRNPAPLDYDDDE